MVNFGNKVKARVAARNAGRTERKRLLKSFPDGAKPQITTFHDEAGAILITLTTIKALDKHVRAATIQQHPRTRYVYDAAGFIGATT